MASAGTGWVRWICSAAAPIVLVVACAPDGRGGAAETASAAPGPEGVVRTADPALRGLSEEEFPRIRRLADGVYSYEQLRSAGEERFTTVSMFVISEAGVLVADGQGSVEETRRLVEAIESMTAAPITHVVVCSDHGDHTAGNSAFPRDAEFIAHPASAANLAAAASRSGRSAEGPPVVMPTRLVEDHEIIELGDREIHVRFLGRAHTGGDLVVHLPAEGIVFMSEAFLNRVFPAMRSAFPSEWVVMLERAEALGAETYVPGHGFVDPPAVLREELVTYRNAVAAVIAEVSRLHEDGMEVEEALEEANFGELESWSLRASQKPMAIRRVYMELDGDLPASGDPQ